MGSLPSEQSGKLGQLMDPQLLLDAPKLKELQASLPADLQPVASQLVSTIKGVFSDALTTTFFVAACIMVAGAVIAIFLRAMPLVSAQDAMKKSQGADETEKLDTAGTK